MSRFKFKVKSLVLGLVIGEKGKLKLLTPKDRWPKMSYGHLIQHFLIRSEADDLGHK